MGAYFFLPFLHFLMLDDNERNAFGKVVLIVTQCDAALNCQHSATELTKDNVLIFLWVLSAGAHNFTMLFHSLSSGDLHSNPLYYRWVSINGVHVALGQQ